VPTFKKNNHGLAASDKARGELPENMFEAWKANDESTAVDHHPISAEICVHESLRA